MPRPQDIATLRLVENLIRQREEAITAIEERWPHLNGWPNHGDTTHVTTSRPTSITEQQATIRADALTGIEHINTHLATIATIAAAGITEAHTLKGLRPPTPPQPDTRPRCSSLGLEGADLHWDRKTDNPNNGWADPLCNDTPRNGTHGLCDRCRVRYGRWRRRNGQPPLADEHPAA